MVRGARRLFPVGAPLRCHLVIPSVARNLSLACGLRFFTPLRYVQNDMVENLHG